MRAAKEILQIKNAGAMYAGAVPGLVEKTKIALIQQNLNYTYIFANQYDPIQQYWVATTFQLAAVFDQILETEELQRKHRRAAGGDARPSVLRRPRRCSAAAPRRRAGGRRSDPRPKLAHHPGPLAVAACAAALGDVGCARLSKRTGSLDGRIFTPGCVWIAGRSRT